jgi:hypothetical protein
MDYRTIRRIDEQEREIGRLRRELDQRPLISVSATSTKQLKLVIIDGQTVYNSGGTTYYGINWSNVAITTVPVLYDPTVSQVPGTFTAVTGIGRAILWTNNVASTTPVLVIHSTTYSSFSYPLINTDPVVAGPAVSIPVSGGGGTSIVAYTVSFP